MGNKQAEKIVKQETPLITIVNPKKGEWNEEDDAYLLNSILGSALDFLKSEELTPKELSDLTDAVEKVMRRKRINTFGYDAKPVAEILRQEEQNREEDDEEKLPVASLHPELDTSQF